MVVVEVEDVDAGRGAVVLVVGAGSSVVVGASVVGGSVVGGAVVVVTTTTGSGCSTGVADVAGAGRTAR